MRRGWHKLFGAGIGLSLFGLPALAVEPISYTGGIYSENFDSLPKEPPQSSTTYPGTDLYDIPGLPAWQMYLFNETFRVENGTTISAGAFIGSFGQDNGADRALGSMGSARGAPTYRLLLRNDTGQIQNHLHMEYFGEHWRSQDTFSTNELMFHFVTAPAVGGLALFSDLNDYPALKFSVPFATGIEARDGNAEQNRYHIVGDALDVNWMPGHILALGWQDRNHSGTDDYLAINDLSLRVLKPRDLRWNAQVQEGEWNDTSSNMPWTKLGPQDEEPANGQSSAFRNGDSVEFSEDVDRMVNVQITGKAVRPGSMRVSHNVGTYFISSLGILNVPLQKTGNGTLLLNTETAFSSVDISGGVVENIGGWSGAMGPMYIANATLRTSSFNQLIESTINIQGTVIFDQQTDLLSYGSIEGLSSGTLVKAGPAILETHLNVRSLDIQTGTLKLRGNSASAVSQLMIASDSQLDVSNLGLVVSGGELDSFRTALASGRGSTGGVATGQWNGITGITSSTAAQAFVTNNKETLSIGYALNGDLLTSYTTFLGQPVADSDILIRLTRNADANLDGIVNNNDITILAGFYRPGQNGKHWYQADFNYDGLVDNNDITILAGFYAPDAAPVIGSSGALLAAVPEPSVGLLCLPLVAIFRRSRSTLKQ